MEPVTHFLFGAAMGPSRIQPQNRARDRNHDFGR